MRRSIIAVLLAFFLGFGAWAGPSPQVLLAAAIATGPGLTFVMKGSTTVATERAGGDNSTNLRTFQVYGQTTAGAGASVVNIEGSNDGTVWITLGTVTLTLGVTTTQGGFVSQSPWNYIRANVASISGTNAAVTATLGG